MPLKRLILPVLAALSLVGAEVPGRRDLMFINATEGTFTFKTTVWVVTRGSNLQTSQNCTFTRGKRVWEQGWEVEVPAMDPDFKGTLQLKNYSPALAPSIEITDATRKNKLHIAWLPNGKVIVDPKPRPGILDVDGTTITFMKESFR